MLTGQPGRRVLSLPGELNRAWHLVMACCYHSRSRGTAHGIFTLQKKQHAGCFADFMELWQQFVTTPYSEALLGQGDGSSLSSIPRNKGAVGFCLFFYLKMQKQSGNQQTELIINKKLQV